MKTRLIDYPVENIAEYKVLLKSIASLTNLFSSSSAPMIYYRAAENIYCYAFGAMNTARGDNSADAIYGTSTGVGIKTFLEKSGLQKIAEFNQLQPFYKDKTGLELLRYIATARNDRIDSTCKQYNLDQLIYHCITRNDEGVIKVFELPMPKIQVDSIRIIKTTPTKYLFTDGRDEYEFYIPKSTLLMRFRIPDDPFITIQSRIEADPYALLLSYVKDFAQRANKPEESNDCSAGITVTLPLYSFTRGKHQEPIVSEKSGLNQWNGYRTKYDKNTNRKLRRKRDPNECYIPIKKSFYSDFPSFFPIDKNGIGMPFQLILPNGKTLSAKVCQENQKALMTNPNSDLGKWLLREVLRLPIGHVVTYEDLARIGIDSIQIRKIGNRYYLSVVSTGDDSVD